MEQEPKPKSKNSIFGGLAVLGIAFMKFKLFIFMMLKQGLSMFIMIGVYAMFFGPIYALIVVALILIHESGHYIFMKFFGLDPKLPVFIPFFGAFVAMEKLPPDQAVDAWVSLAGPLVGGVTSVILFFFGVQQGNGIMMAAGSTGCFFNLLQLIPAKPFDGGFVINAIAKWVLIPGAAMVFLAAYLLESPLFFILGIFSAFSAYRSFTGQVSERDLIKPATGLEKVMIGMAYFTLAGALGYIYYLSSDALVSFLPANKT
ncbi:site-2 protease family protein [bacterium]|nr:site-2 protease family protein [bacterium]